MTWREKKMKRKIPLFRLSTRPNVDVDYSQILQAPGIKQAILEESFQAIKDGITRNKKTISLFEVAHSNCYINLDKTKWKPTLKKAMEYYLQSEDFDKCAECRDLINKL